MKDSIVGPLLIILMAIGWFYYIYICVVTKSVGFLIAGFFVPIISAPIGLWSLLFGAPSWLTGF